MPVCVIVITPNFSNTKNQYDASSSSPTLFHPFSSPTVTSHTLQLSSTIHASGRMVMVVGLGWVLTWSVLIVTWFQWERYWLIEKTCLTWKLSWGNWAAFSLNLLLKYYDGLDDWEPSTQKLVLKVKLKQQNQHSVLYLLLFALQQHHSHTQTWASCTA